MKKIFKIFSYTILISIFILFSCIFSNLKPINSLIKKIDQNILKYQIVDSNNNPLNTTYQNDWNLFNNISLYDLKPLFKDIIIFAEDKNFYSHNGIDWLARLNALFLNIKHFKRKRGASTITEQVVRIVYPRKRTIISKLIEGFDAISLEKNMNKDKILEFYINQVPFSSNRRGFAEAAKFYFNRNLNNLTLKEMLFLIVNLRAPSNFNKNNNANIKLIEKKINTLANKLYEKNIINDLQLNYILDDELNFNNNNNNIDAKHFLSFIRNKNNINNANEKILKTSLNPDLQKYINKLTLNTLKYFNNRNYNVKNGGVLVINRKTMQIISYNSLSINNDKNGDIDCIQIKRKSGSTLKPFLYGLALQNGLTLASKIDDSPMNQQILHGSHSFFNASHKFYGTVTLREALANSLNIPSIKIAEYVGINNFFNLLKKSGFNNFEFQNEHYGVGLAVGAGEVTLFELVRAFAILANNGVYKEINYSTNQQNIEKKRILDDETTNLITSVLSDRTSRRIEFSRDSILNFPNNIAIKTGTSADYKDAWAIGYNDDYIAGVWLGNVGYESMNLMSGALGPGLILRNIFNELGKFEDIKPIKINKSLIKRKINNYEEYFSIKDYQSMGASFEIPNINFNLQSIKITNPFNQSKIAINPRIPIENQKIEFDFSGKNDVKDFSWEINGEKLNNSIWKLKHGKHFLTLRVRDINDNVFMKKSTFFCN